MNRIILAYAPENAAAAEKIDRQLSRIGIPFEHARDKVAKQIAASGEPVLLLVTDNFLKNRASLEGLLPVLKTLAAENRLVAVLADGVDEEGRTLHTQIDRMSNVLQYMNHWQGGWLEVSDRHQQAEGAEKETLFAQLEALRGIANEVGDVIGMLREQGYCTLAELEANDFALFFQKFALSDWHGQYRRLAAQEDELLENTQASHLPEVTVSGGLLTPEPIETPDFAAETIPEPEHTASVAMPDSGEETEIENEEEPSVDVSGEIAQAVRDAWFWIEKGHAERGIELFQIALEQYPDDEILKAEYGKALAQTPPQQEETEKTPTPPPAHEPTVSNELKSYDLMGDMAIERGDYLFAKYCWDRVLEIDPEFPGIYRKLGLMTAEHLPDYKETAAAYLQKALEINPKDKTAKKVLGNLTVPSGEQLEVAGTAPANTGAGQQAEVSPTSHASIPVQESKKGLVLITGATSGIGRATAELFARNGYRLILTGRRVERLVELKNQFESEFGSDVLLLPFDVRDVGAVEAALANLPDAYKEIDILINNAGLAKGLTPIQEGNLEHWETMIDTNVKGLLYVTRIVSKGMVQRRKGQIINVGSSAGKETYPNGNVYCATKFAVDALTKAMRMDLHSHGIRVGQVSPGHVEETEFALNRFDGDAERAKIYQDFQPLKSIDVADAIFYMATRPSHVNIQDLQLFGTQQASSMIIDRSGR